MSASVPMAWAGLIADLNGHVRIGQVGVRDVDAPCEAFVPFDDRGSVSMVFGDCDTDGHYVCLECTRISEAVSRRRRGLCDDCGGKLGPKLHCSACDGVTS